MDGFFSRIFQRDIAKQLPNEVLNDQIRLVAYQNSTTILFDTLQIDYVKSGAAKQQQQQQPQPKQATLQPNAAGKSPARPTLPSGRIEMLKEMMFGTVPMNFQGTTTKIHYLPESNQLLLTKLFTLNLQRDEDSNDNKNTKQNNNNSNNSNNNNNNNNINSNNNNTDVKKNEQTTEQQQPKGDEQKDDEKKFLSERDLPLMMGKSSSQEYKSGNDIQQMTSSDSNIKTTSTTTSTGTNTSTSPKSPPPVSKTTDSIPTLNRTRSQSTMGSKGTTMLLQRVGSSPGQVPKVKKVTLALCIILGPRSEFITPSTATANASTQAELLETLSKFHQFIITHFMFIDIRIKPIIKLLKNQIYSKFTALVQSKNHGSLSGYGVTEINQIYKHVETFRQYIKDLYYAPRLEKSLWLDTLRNPSTKRQTYITFLENLRELLPIYNTPKSKFFISTIISSILTYNLTWASNILSTSNDSTSYRCTSDRCNQFYNFENQFLYQLSEMFGYTGCLSPQCKNTKASYKLSKFILISSKEDLAKKFLQTISYFWRTFELILNRTSMEYLTSLYNSDELTKNFMDPTATSNTTDHQQQSHIQNGATTSMTHLNPGYHNNSTPMKYNTIKPTTSSSSTHSTTTTAPASNTQNNHQTNFNIGTNEPTLPPYLHNIPRSMMGGYTNKYISDMALQSVPKNDFFPQLVDDLRLWLDHSPFPTPIKELTAIVADISKFSTEVVIVSKENSWSDTNPIQVNGIKYPDVKIVKHTCSEYISTTLSTIIYFWTLGMPPESCIIYLEDKLRELFFKTLRYHETLKYYVTINQPIPPNINLLPSGVTIPSYFSLGNTPLATPKSSPQASVTNYNGLNQQMSGDQLLLESIYLYLCNCQNYSNQDSQQPSSPLVMPPSISSSPP